MLRNLVFLIAGAVFLIGTAPKAAQAAPIFPPLVSGDYCFSIKTGAVTLDAEGVPDRAPSRSVAVRIIGDPAVLSCTPASPDELVPVCVTVPALGDRAELRGFAFAEPACAGEESLPSGNGAYVFFTPPAEPSLELSP